MPPSSRKTLILETYKELLHEMVSTLNKLPGFNHANSYASYVIIFTLNLKSLLLLII